MTKEEARLFKSRWQLVNEARIEEIRQATASTKLRQLADMFAAGRALGWADKRAANETEVRSRWVRLKEKAHG